MRTRYEPADMEAILREMAGESDRAAITVGGALVEHTLELLIKTKLRSPQNNTEAGYLFSDTGILGTFWQKIWAAYFLQLIGPSARKELDVIRSIRNEVAHNMNPVSFADRRIYDKCLNLKIIGESVIEPNNPRMRFSATIHIFASTMAMKSAALSDPTNTALKEAISGLGRYLE
jgi:hypothetical protein